MGRKCNVNLCESSSNRIEDQGVTFHKLPVNEHFKLIWLAQCHMPLDARNRTVYVCSRHFRRVDFQAFKGTKYMLKTGAIPSMFAWGRTTDEELEKMTIEASGMKNNADSAINTDDCKTENYISPKNNNLNSNKDTNATNSDSNSRNQTIPNNKTTESVREKPKRASAQNLIKRGWAKKSFGSKEIGTPVNKTTNKSQEGKKKESPIKEKKELNGTDHESKEIHYDLKAMNLVPGSRVEAKNFNEQWTTARVVEVDNDENEILIQFESSKSDEWIPMNSSRLRPIQLARDNSSSSNSRMYKEGERCMARWTDSRKFPATVRRVLENDSYEVLFDDGYIKTLPGSHISRANKSKGNMVDSSGNPLHKKSTNLSSKSSNHLNSSSLDEWCCRWEGDQPVGVPGYIETNDGVKRPSTIVQDPRLPEGWIKHIVKRNTGGYTGKWDVVIVHTATNRKFRSKKEIDSFFADSDKPYKSENFDFGLHRKRSKEIGWDTTPVKRKKLTHANSNHNSSGYEKILKKLNTPKQESAYPDQVCKTPEMDSKDLEDGFVFVGSLKVQIIDNLFRCPEPVCGKNFRKENLLQMHIKHYHPNLTQHFSSTPNVADLAYARTIRETAENEPVAKNRYSNTQFYDKVSKIDNINKRIKSPPDFELPIKQIDIKLEKIDVDSKDISQDIKGENGSPNKDVCDGVKSCESAIIKLEPRVSYSESPLLEEALRVDNKNKIKHHVTFENESSSRRYMEPPVMQKVPGGGIKRLFPKKREEQSSEIAEDIKIESLSESDIVNNDSSKLDQKLVLNQKRQRVETSAGLIQKLLKRRRKKNFMKRNARLMMKEDPEITDLVPMKSDDGVQRHSNSMANYPKTPESPSNHGMDEMKISEQHPVNDVPDIPRVYINEDGEEIKLVRMRREEIINCACGHREEDGLMIQCELCLCWQHALCHGIQRERDVPEKYVCTICCNPLKPRHSRRYMHDQEWLLEGRLPTLVYKEKNSECTNNSEQVTNLQDFTKSVHETTGNALELMPVLKSLRAKLSMAMQTHHPKFYYWAKPWNKYSDMNNDINANQDQTAATSSSSNMEMGSLRNNMETSPTLQALQRDLCNAVNESELLGARIENEMNLLKSKNMHTTSTNDVNISANSKNGNNSSSSISSLIPSGTNIIMNTETPSRGLNLDSETKVDDFAALAKNDVLDLSAILESNHVIPTDSELVSILEGDLKTENDLNSPMRGNKQDDDCKINMDLLSFMSSDDTKMMDSGKSLASLKSTSSGDLTDSHNLLAPLLASPGGTKFDLVSDRELENFAQSMGQEVLITTSAPVPEEAIDNEQCRWNLLRHISDYQSELEKRLDQFNVKLSVLLTSPEAPPSDIVKLDRDCTRLVKMMQRDLQTLEDTCSVMSVERKEPDNAKVLQNQELEPRVLVNRSVTPPDVKRLW